jgi:hypothetical protein
MLPDHCTPSTPSASSVDVSTTRLSVGCRRSAMEARADEVFARFSRYRGDGLVNHCYRMNAFATALLEGRGVPVDRSLLYAIAMVHDLGLLVPGPWSASYLDRSCALFHTELPSREFPLSDHERRVADECLLYNHRVLSVPGLSPEAEAFREAVWIEHSLGLLSYGLDADVVRSIRARFPRDNLDAILADFARRVLLREPWTMVDGIFF